MLKRSCLIIGALFIAAFAGYFYFLRSQPIDTAAVWLLSFFGSLFSLMFVGSIATAIRSFQELKIFQASTSGRPFKDGETIGISGKIRPTGFPAQSPLQKKECVLYEYEIGNQGPQGQKDYTGIRLVPCTIRVPQGDIKLLGFSILEHFKSSERDTSHLENAQDYIATTQFEKVTLGKSINFIGDFMSAMADDDGTVRKDWQLGNAAEIHSGTYLSEKIVEPGQDVCAIGTYSAQANGIIPTKKRLVQLYPGNLEANRHRIGGEKRFTLLMGFIFFALIHLFIGVVLYMSRHRDLTSTPSEQASSLQVAAQDRDFESMERILKSGISPDVRDSSGSTMLQDTRDIDVARILIAHGANVNVRNKDWDETPLFQAARYGNNEMVHLLLKAGADLNAVSKIPWDHMPFHAAIDAGHEDTARILLDAGARDDRVTAVDGKPIAKYDKPLAVCKSYIEAVHEKNIEAIRSYTMIRDSHFYDGVDFKIWQDARPLNMELVEGYWNDTAATLSLQSPDGGMKWFYQLTFRDGRWLISREWSP